MFSPGLLALTLPRKRSESGVLGHAGPGTSSAWLTAGAVTIILGYRYSETYICQAGRAVTMMARIVRNLRVRSRELARKDINCRVDIGIGRSTKRTNPVTCGIPTRNLVEASVRPSDKERLAVACNARKNSISV